MQILIFIYCAVLLVLFVNICGVEELVVALFESRPYEHLGTPPSFEILQLTVRDTNFLEFPHVLEPFSDGTIL